MTRASGFPTGRTLLLRVDVFDTSARGRMRYWGDGGYSAARLRKPGRVSRPVMLISPLRCRRPIGDQIRPIGLKATGRLR
jgi:hypothetical protein